jgi:hypothetical protein
MKSLRIISDGTPQGTRILDERGDEVNLAIRSVSFTCDYAGSDTVLQLECRVPMDVDGKASVETINPVTGNFERISSIKFADGTEWRADQ